MIILTGSETSLFTSTDYAQTDIASPGIAAVDSFGSAATPKPIGCSVASNAINNPSHRNLRSCESWSSWVYRQPLTEDKTYHSNRLEDYDTDCEADAEVETDGEADSEAASPTSVVLRHTAQKYITEKYIAEERKLAAAKQTSPVSRQLFSRSRPPQSPGSPTSEETKAMLSAVEDVLNNMEVSTATAESLLPAVSRDTDDQLVGVVRPLSLVGTGPQNPQDDIRHSPQQLPLDTVSTDIPQTPQTAMATPPFEQHIAPSTPFKAFPSAANDQTSSAPATSAVDFVAKQCVGTVSPKERFRASPILDLPDEGFDTSNSNYDLEESMERSCGSCDGKEGAEPGEEEEPRNSIPEPAISEHRTPNNSVLATEPVFELRNNHEVSVECDGSGEAREPCTNSHGTLVPDERDALAVPRQRKQEVERATAPDEAERDKEEPSSSLRVESSFEEGVLDTITPENLLCGNESDVESVRPFITMSSPSLTMADQEAYDNAQEALQNAGEESLGRSMDTAPALTASIDMHETNLALLRTVVPDESSGESSTTDDIVASKLTQDITTHQLLRDATDTEADEATMEGEFDLESSMPGSDYGGWTYYRSDQSVDSIIRSDAFAEYDTKEQQQLPHAARHIELSTDKSSLMTASGSLLCCNALFDNVGGIIGSPTDVSAASLSVIGLEAQRRLFQQKQVLRSEIDSVDSDTTPRSGHVVLSI